MKKSNKNVWLLGGSSFFNDVGSEMITPLLPLYINQIGGGGIAVGLLSGLREGISSIVKLFGGWLSDKNGKRMPLIFLGYFLSSILKIMLFFTGTWQSVLSIVSLERIGKVRDAPRDAIIATSTKKRGKSFGIHQMMDTAGAVIGVSILIFIFWKFNLTYKSIFLIGGLIALMSIIPLFFVHEKKYVKNREGIIGSVKKINKKLVYFIIVSSIFTLGNFGLYMFLILLANNITNSLIITLVFVLVFNVFFALFSLYFGKLSDKIGRKKVLLIGYSLFLIVCLSSILAKETISLLVIFATYGLVNAATNSDQRAYVADLSGKNKGTSIGFYNMVIGLVNIPAGLIAGLFWNISPKIMFVYLSTMAMIALILLLFVKNK